jgi:SAM-dependent methyltransferase
LALDHVRCPICDGAEFDVLRCARYPQGLTQSELTKIYCSSSDSTLMDQVARCKGCDLVYLNPRVNAATIIASYSDAMDPRFADQNEHRISTFKRVFQKWTKRFGLSERKLDVLDLGCAGGAFPKAASLLGHRPIGIEPSKFLSNWARQTYGLDIRTGILADHQIPQKSLDVVTLWDVIEHLSNPGAELDRIHTLLKDDGHLIINYPEFDCWQRRLMGWKWPFFLSVHLFYFTPATARRLLRRHGFEAVEIRTFYQTLPMGYVLERAGQIFGLFKLFAKLAKAIGLGALPFTYSIGQTMVTARKAKTK